MTLTETFAKHTNQEFPPPYVFVYDGDEPKTILVSEIAEYETMYKNTEHVRTEFGDIGTQLSDEWAIPLVVAIEDVDSLV